MSTYYIETETKCRFANNIFNTIFVLYFDSNFTEWYSYGFCNSNESFVYELMVNSKQAIVCVNVIEAYMYL